MASISLWNFSFCSCIVLLILFSHLCVLVVYWTLRELFRILYWKDLHIFGVTYWSFIIIVTILVVSCLPDSYWLCILVLVSVYWKKWSPLLDFIQVCFCMERVFTSQFSLVFWAGHLIASVSRLGLMFRSPVGWGHCHALWFQDGSGEHWLGSFIEWTCYLFSTFNQSYYLSSLVSWRCVLWSDRASNWTLQLPLVEQESRLCSLGGHH